MGLTGSCLAHRADPFRHRPGKAPRSTGCPGTPGRAGLTLGIMTWLKVRLYAWLVIRRMRSRRHYPVRDRAPQGQTRTAPGGG